MSVSTYVRTWLCKHDVILICTARGWAHRGGVLQIYSCANSSLFGLTFSKLSPWTKQQALRYELFKDLWELLLNKNGVAVKNKRVNSVFCFHYVVGKWQDYHSQVDMWVVVYPFHIFFLSPVLFRRFLSYWFSAAVWVVFLWMVDDVDPINSERVTYCLSRYCVALLRLYYSTV